MSGTVVTVGTFDGVHRGHQAVLAEITRRARGRGTDCASVLVTFEPHPLEIVNPAAAPRRLTTLAEKQAILAALPIDRVAVVPFTRELSQLTPEAFVRQVLVAQFAMQELVLGYDHGFGRGRSGDVAVLRRLGESDGFAVDVVEAVQDEWPGGGKQAISSTLVRTAVAHGDLTAAARWLGRPYAVRGVVERGAGRGRTIGIPTINLAPLDARKLLPPDGVYAVRVAVEENRGRGMGDGGAGARYGGMMNQGPRPTFGEAARTLEVHLFEFDGDLYGRTVTVEWVERLRDVQAFPSRDALVAQLERDRQAARASLNR